MRFLTKVLSAIAGVFRRTPAPESDQTNASSSQTMELTDEELELLTTNS